MFELGLVEAVWGARAVMPHMLKGDVTPVLDTVWVRSDGFFATDRYSVGWFETEISGEVPENMKLPRGLVEWLAKFKWNSLTFYERGFSGKVRDYKVRFELLENSVRVSIVYVGGVSEVIETDMHFNLAVSGNFPPVDRLFDGLKPTRGHVTSLKPRFLEKFTKPFAQFNKEHPALFEFARNEYSDKPGVVAVSFDYDDSVKGKFKGLLQPNLLLKDDWLDGRLVREGM